jgi:predicted GIY-YIG superfamily endonuclease
MEPLLLFPCVYVLKLEDDCMYVGITLNFNQRLAQHFSGQGSKWTKLHKPVSVLEVVYPATLAIENEVTKRYMGLYGDKVRGGSYCAV